MTSVISLGLSACSSVQQQWPKPIDPDLSAATAARMIVPRALQLVGVDGQPYKLPALQPDPYELLLKPGERELRMVYIDGRYKDGDNDNTLISDTMLIRVALLSNQVYRVDFNDPSNYQQAAKMAAEPSFWVDDPVSNARVSSSLSVPYKRFSLAGLGATAESRKPQPSAQASEFDTRPDGVAHPLHELKHWWQQANSTQRNQFLDWVSEQ